MQSSFGEVNIQKFHAPYFNKIKQKQKQKITIVSFVLF